MYILKWFCFIIAEIYNILRYVIASYCDCMCNLHIKETEISQKRSKGIKNWKVTYSVILNVLSNKTNSILGFTSPLTLSLLNHPICYFTVSNARHFYSSRDSLDKLQLMLNQFQLWAYFSLLLIEELTVYTSCLWLIQAAPHFPP